MPSINRNLFSGQFMSAGGVTLVGLAEATAALDRLAKAASALASRGVAIGSDLPYAWGQHWGYYRNAKLARRAGATLYLLTPMRANQDRIKTDLARALPDGPEAVQQTMDQITSDIVSQAQDLAPVKTGNLRASIHTEYRDTGRGAPIFFG